MEHHGCIEIVLQGIGPHKNAFLVAISLEYYVWLHYFERGKGPQGGFWGQVSLRGTKAPRPYLGFGGGK